MEDEALIEIDEQQPTTKTRTLSAELGSSQSISITQPCEETLSRRSS